MSVNPAAARRCDEPRTATDRPAPPRAERTRPLRCRPHPPASRPALPAAVPAPPDPLPQRPPADGSRHIHHRQLRGVASHAPSLPAPQAPRRSGGDPSPLPWPQAPTRSPTPDRTGPTPAHPEAANATAANSPRYRTTAAGSRPDPGGSDADTSHRSSPRHAHTTDTTTVAEPRPDRPQPATPRPQPQARIRSARLLVQPTTPGCSTHRGGQPVHGHISLAGPSPVRNSAL